MPIYTNGSTFPIVNFSYLDNRKFESYDDLKKFIFIEFPGLNKDFESVLKDSIRVYEMQHLFQIITIYSLRAVFNKSHRKITLKDNVKSTSIKDIVAFLSFLNMRIDLIKIEENLDSLLDSEKAKIDKKELISGIIIFTYKYLYVKFANLIYCNVEDNVREVMDFKYYSKVYQKYKLKYFSKKYNSVDYHQTKIFLENYKKSFNTEDFSKIDEITNEILIYTNDKKSEIILNSIIDRNIHLDESFSSIKKNRILLPYFKSITCVFFYKHFINEKSDSKELINHFKKFRLRMKK